MAVFVALPCLAQAAGSSHNPAQPSGQILASFKVAPETAKAAGDGLEGINDLLSGWIADSEIKKARERIAPVVDKLTPKEGDGYLLRIDLYKTSNGQKVLGNGGNIDQIGPGRTQQQAAEKYLSADHISAQPPAGLLRDEEDSFLVWLQRKGGHLLETKIPYPFADLTFHMARMTLDHAHDEAAQRAKKLKKQQEQRDEDLKKAQQERDRQAKAQQDATYQQQQRQRQQEEQEQQAQRDRDRKREEEDRKERDDAARQAALKRHEEEQRQKGGGQPLPSPTYNPYPPSGPITIEPH